MIDTSNENRLFIITGGPGAGKTTLVDALGAAGFATCDEAGRAIIKDQLAVGGAALPWSDRGLFAELMLAWELRSYREAARTTSRVIFDRGVPDVVGYLRLCGLEVPARFITAAQRFRYHSRVFMAPPWREIFAQDAERRQDFAEAVRTYDALAATYRDCGYELIELPRGSVEARVAFVAGYIHQQGAD